jgi:hypothetical protein
MGPEVSLCRGVGWCLSRGVFSSPFVVGLRDFRRRLAQQAVGAYRSLYSRGWKKIAKRGSEYFSQLQAKRNNRKSGLC